ncbi:MAG: RDD family protein [Pirellulales bacterium]|nr:RDD family protein [Pirellulales bacterium]
MADQRGQLDTSIEIITPENIAFQYHVAGPFRRLPAYLIDLLIRAVILGVAAIGAALSFGLLGLGPMWWMGAILVFGFVLTWFYGGLFETYYNGQTPGKRLMQIRVVSTNGQPINGMQAVMRNVLRAIDAQPFYLSALVASMMNDRFQRLGDLACGTMVVIEERRWFEGLMRTGEPEAAKMAGLIPADFQPSRTLARALAIYVQRRRMFSWPRRLEIARHLGEPLREKFNLPPATNLDLLLCGLYHRTFITDRGEDEIREGSPFLEMQTT